jgi:hypothetical protein
MPDSFQGIRLRGVGWQIVNLDVFAMFGEPIPNISILVVRSVVLDQKDFAWEIVSEKLFQVEDIGLGIEDLLKPVEESSGIQLDGAENFQCLFLPGSGNFGLASYSSPCLIEGGVLPETRFVLEEKGRPFAFGFFLMSG